MGRIKNWFGNLVVALIFPIFLPIGSFVAKRSLEESAREMEGGGDHLTDEGESVDNSTDSNKFFCLGAMLPLGIADLSSFIK